MKLDISHINTLSELQNYVESYEGCPLKKNAQSTVFCDGDPHSKIMLIGEAPGREEDEQGKPFVGRSGQLLTKLFAEEGMPRESLYITNMCFWRPPENRTPTKEELATTYDLVLKHIELQNPDVVVLVGGTSAQALLHTKVGVTKLRGEWQSIALPSGKMVPAMVVFHPAYLLRSRSKIDVMREDLRLIFNKVK